MKGVKDDWGEETVNSGKPVPSAGLYPEKFKDQG